MAGKKPSITILPSAARTVTTNSDEIDLGDYEDAVAFLNVSAQAGVTPTLDVKVQCKDPLSGNWVDSGDAFAQVAAATGTFIKRLTKPFANAIRFVCTIAGTAPSYTFSLSLVPTQK